MIRRRIIKLKKANTWSRVFILFYLSAIVFMSCSSDSKNVKEIPPADSVTEEEFADEGFISADSYRIIIVEPKEYVDSDNEDYIRRAATRRAMLSIQKYLRSRNRNIDIDRNVNANILNLINDYGELKMCVKQQERRNVHSFEIKKPGLRKYLDSMAQER